jgi:hypothetical protein
MWLAVKGLLPASGPRGRYSRVVCRLFFAKSPRSGLRHFNNGAGVFSVTLQRIYPKATATWASRVTVLFINKENYMRDSKDSNGTLAIALLGGAVAAGPILGIWPLVGVFVACGSVLFVASLLKDRR